MGLLDQSIVSASNFTAMWLMARKLPAADYGLYVMVMGMILALNSIQSALVMFPFTVRYAAADLQAWQSAAIRCLVINLASTAIQIPIIIAGCLYLGNLAVAWAAILTVCFWQGQEFLRRAMFQRNLLARAIISDSVRYVLPALIVVFLPRQILSTQVILSATAGASAAALLTCLSVLAGAPSSVSWKRTSLEIRDSWKIGRSIILYNIFGSALTQGSIWILGDIGGLTTASQFQAVSNLMGITNPPVQGIGSVQDPAVARSYVKSGPRAAIRHAGPYLGIVAALVIPILVFFILAPSWTLLRFYGKTSPYLNLALPLQIAAIGQFLAIGAQLSNAMLACLRRAEIGWRVQMVTSVACLAVLIPAVQRGRLLGYLTVLTLFYGIRLAAMVWSLCIIYKGGSAYLDSAQTATANA